MTTGYNGRAAISWTQTEIDGLENAPLASLAVGAAWSWRGQAVMLDTSVVCSIGQTGYADGFTARATDRFAATNEVSGRQSGSVVMTNGAQSFTAALIVEDNEIIPTLVFEDSFPPRDQDFWISEVSELEMRRDVETETGATVIAFPSMAKTQDAWVDDGRLVATNSPRPLHQG